MKKITQDFYQSKTKKTIQRFLFLFVLVATALSANAATITSNPGTFNWSDTNAWVGGVLPIAGDDIVIASGSTISYDLQRTVTSTGYSGTTVCPSVPNAIVYSTTTPSFGSLTVNGTLNTKAGLDPTYTLEEKFSAVTVNVGGTYRVGIATLVVGTSGTYSTSATNIYGTIDFSDITFVSAWVTANCPSATTYVAKGHTFYGDVTLYSGSTWNCPNEVGINWKFYGNFTNNATTFTPGTNTGNDSYFYGVDKHISGATPTVFSGGLGFSAKTTIDPGASVTVSASGSRSVRLVAGVLSLVNQGTFNVGKDIITWTSASSLDASYVGNTVNFIRPTLYTIPYAVAFYNLGIAGTGAKTLTLGTTVAGKLSIITAAPVTLATGENIVVKALELDGVTKAAGTYGGTISTATNIIDTFFGATSTGIVTNSNTLKVNSAIFNKNSVNVFSNAGKISLSNITSSTQVEVYSMTGALVKSVKTTSDTSIDVNAGVYVVKVKSAEGTKSVKVIVK